MSYLRALFIFQIFQKIFDILAVIFAWYLCWLIRFETSFLPITKGVPDFAHYSKIALPLAAVFSAAFHALSVYRSDRILFSFKTLKKLFEGSLFGTLLFVAVCYFLGELSYSRLYIVLFLFCVFVTLIAERLCLELLWRKVFIRFVSAIRILSIGSNEILNIYLKQIKNYAPYPVGVSHFDDLTPYEIKKIIAEKNIDTVVVSTEEVKAKEIVLTLSSELINLKLIPDFGKYNTFIYKSDQEYGVPLLLFNQIPYTYSDRLLKRTLDILGSGFFLALFSPLYLLLALLVKLSSKGPVFYSQKRIGADGKEFLMFKFRSMRMDAEVSTGAVWAIQNDSRVTSIGRFLRKSSLDEIPQFYNVLRGDMSIVGPRPERPEFVSTFRKEIPQYMLRHKMKSGITGWAQVNGWRGNTSIEERIKFDLFYIRNYSLLFDIKIMLLTFIKGFIHKNAY
jgi:exopolysaccharide biosynthesis polyprenyl glycosylphosphotransferase